MGYGIVLYANARPARRSGWHARAPSRAQSEGHVEEDPDHGHPVCLERQRLVNKAIWDSMEEKYQ